MSGVRTQRAVGALFGALLLVAGILLLLQAMGAAVAVGLFWGVLFLAAMFLTPLYEVVPIEAVRERERYDGGGRPVE